MTLNVTLHYEIRTVEHIGGPRLELRLAANNMWGTDYITVAYAPDTPSGRLKLEDMARKPIPLEVTK